MKVNLLNNQKTFRLIQETQLLKAIQMAVMESHLKKLWPSSQKIELNVVFLDSKMIEKINKQYLGHHGSTDVITFDYWQERPLKMDSDSFLIGEILLNLNMAAETSPCFNNSLSKESLLYIVHGILHLCGMDDKLSREKELMKVAQLYIMDIISLKFDLNSTIFFERISNHKGRD